MLISFVYSETSLSALVIKLDVAMLWLPAKRLSYCTGTDPKSKCCTSSNKFYITFSTDSPFTLEASTFFINAVGSAFCLLIFNNLL